jgi:hypothetical protein
LLIVLSLVGAGSTESSPTAAATPVQSAAWLERINYYRVLAALSPIADDSSLSANVAAHAHYLLTNFTKQIGSGAPLGDAAFEESPSRAGFSPEAEEAARNSQVAWGCGNPDAAQKIDRIISGPFHRPAILDPEMTQAGFGEASDAGCWVTVMRLPPPLDEVGRYPHPVEFPTEGAKVRLAWMNGESPDPLTSCPGYDAPVGLPITIQLGRLVRTEVSAESLTEDDKPIPHCTFEARSYVNPSPSAQEYGRFALRDAGAIVIIPRAPLKAGARYAVSITEAGFTHAWKFSASKP